MHIDRNISSPRRFPNMEWSEKQFLTKENENVLKDNSRPKQRTENEQTEIATFLIRLVAFFLPVE